jgi:hypothetical protein
VLSSPERNRICSGAKVDGARLRGEPLDLLRPEVLRERVLREKRRRPSPSMVPARHGPAARPARLNKGTAFSEEERDRCSACAACCRRT